jgi:hypothetical protein
MLLLVLLCLLCVSFIWSECTCMHTQGCDYLVLDLVLNALHLVVNLLVFYLLQHTQCLCIMQEHILA